MQLVMVIKKVVLQISEIDLELNTRDPVEK